MDVDHASARALSKMDLDQSISIFDDDNKAKEAKIVKETERKISKAMFTHSLI
jgi:hypothetical protein